MNGVITLVDNKCGVCGKIIPQSELMCLKHRSMTKAELNQEIKDEFLKLKGRLGMLKLPEAKSLSKIIDSLVGKLEGGDHDDESSTGKSRKKESKEERGKQW